MPAKHKSVLSAACVWIVLTVQVCMGRLIAREYMPCMFYKGLSAPPSKRDAVFICLVLSVRMCVCWCKYTVICVCLGARLCKGCFVLHMHPL